MVGPVFDVTVDAAHVLGFVFFAMTYATGVPLLMPLLCVACLAFWFVNRLQLLRFEKKPPKFGAALAR